MRRPILIGLLIAGLLLLDISQRIHMITVGYEIERLLGTQRDLKRIHKELLVEREALLSLDRIERIAIQKLGMTRPGAGQIVHVNLDPKDESPPDPQAIKMVKK